MRRLSVVDKYKLNLFYILLRFTKSDLFQTLTYQVTTERDELFI